MTSISTTTVLSSTSDSNVIGPNPSPETTSSSVQSGAPFAESKFEVAGSERGANQQAAKFAGRLNASKVPESEIKALLAERQQLLDKQLEGTITKKEAIRLDYVRWSLDRVEDAKHGAAIDQLESFIEQFEKVASHVNNLRGDLDKAAHKRR